jgi:hypothetical protein
MSMRAATLFLPAICTVLAQSCAGEPPSSDTTDAGPDADSDSDTDADTDTEPDTGDPPHAFSVEAVGDFTAGVHGMAFAGDGTLFFSDSYGHAGSPERVYTLAPPYTGDPAPTGITGAIVSGLAWVADSLYVCVTGEDEVRRYDAALDLQEAWAVPAPWNAALVGPGMLAVTYDGRIFGLGEGGATTDLVAGLEYPFGIADNGDATFWISQQVGAEEDGRVSRWGLCGEQLEVLGHVFANPEGMALDDRGYLYVADTVAGELVRVSPVGDAEVLTDEYEIPIVVARSPGGDIYFNTGGAQSRLVRISLVE